jgi:hypothetical protein
MNIPEVRNFTDQLQTDNIKMREAGCNLAEAALNVIKEYDGLHRLALAVSEWSKVIAEEGGRNEKSV